MHRTRRDVHVERHACATRWLKLKAVIALVLMLMGSACGVQIHSRPPDLTVEKTRVIHQDYEAVWVKAVSWFAANNVVIDKIEKPSGLITAKYSIDRNDDKVVSVGKVWTTGMAYGSPDIRRFADLNVLLRRMDGGQTEVTVNVFGAFEATAWWGLLTANPPPVFHRGVAVSTGYLERAFFQFMDAGDLPQGKANGVAQAGNQESPARSEPRASGSGFVVTPDGYIVTSHHVIRDGSRIEVVSKGVRLQAVAVASDAANDMALLKVDGRFEALAIASSRGVRLGATVATVGFPNPVLQGVAPKLSRGEVSSLSGARDDSRYFQISTPIQPGNSGGALMDLMGNVVGVVVAKLNQAAAVATSGVAAENVSYALKSGYLLTFLESVPAAMAGLVEESRTERKLEEVAGKAEEATVRILVY